MCITISCWRGVRRNRPRRTAAGVLDTILTPFSDSLTYVIDERSRAIGPTIRNGSAGPDLATAMDFSQYGKLLNLTLTQGGNVAEWGTEPEEPLLHMVPTWSDPNTNAADSLEHDGWGRVTSVTYLNYGTIVDSASFSIDRDGNVDRPGSGNHFDETTTRLWSRVGTDTTKYDRAGNMVKWHDGTNLWTYTYDPLERLIAVRAGGTLIARYAYDVLGRRIVKRVYSAGPRNATVAFTRMIYTGSGVVADADSAGALTFAYSWGPGVDNLVAVHKYGAGSGDWYVVQDQLRSVRGLTRKDGTWAVSWRYDIYGAPLDSAGTAPFVLRYRWTTREDDRESGLYFLRARYYSPSVLRFVQEDPIGYAGDINLYSYGEGDPTNGRDPDGLDKEYSTPALDYEPDRVCVDLFSDECWGQWLDGGGAGHGPDFDGDGWDDSREFTEYTWGRLRFNGTVEEWRAVWYGGIANPLQGGLARAALLQIVFWGDLNMADDPSENTYAWTTRPRGGTTDGGVFLPGPAIYLNRSYGWFKYGPAGVAFLLAHETYHYALGIAGVRYVADIEEPAGSCFAYGQVGWGHPRFYYPCW